MTYHTIRCTEEESARLFDAWKQAEGVKNCTQYIKAAINSYARKEIFRGKHHE